MGTGAHFRLAVRATCAAIVVAMGLCGSAATPAYASFPGRNGEVLLSGEGCHDLPDGGCADDGAGTSLSGVSPSRSTARSVQMPGSVYSARWSADGRTLVLPQAFRFYPSPQPAPGLFFMNASQFPRPAVSEPSTSRLAGSGAFSGAAWGPSGLQLVVESNPGLTIVGNDGSRPRRILASGTRPDWSVRDLIAFQRAGNISAIRPDGTGLRRLTSRGGKNGSWSPDGRRLVFERSRALYAVRADGTGRRKLTSRATNPVWSPDGRYIAFLRITHESECGADGTGCDIARLRLIRADGHGKSRAVTTRDGRSREPVRVGQLMDWRPLP